MPIKVMTPSQEQINELRNKFIEKYDNSPPPAGFHPVDVKRVRNEDKWCTLFLEMYDLDMGMAFEKLWSTCEWRQKFGANDLSENNLIAEYLTDGSIFSQNKDVDGKPLLIFKTKLHVKGAKDMDEIIRVVVYWIERIHRETNMDKITVFFDMAGTGLAAMDLEFIKRIIETFKLYYPNALNYILVYEMAWVLNAAFKIVKGMLPAKALEILKMISKKDINTYIDKNNCFTSWGGNDTTEFKFVPEVKQQPLKIHTNGISNGEHHGSTHDKKVHFANGSPTRVPAMNGMEEDFKPLEHDMLRVTPNDFITFPRSGDVIETILEIASISKFPVTYKIQTTSPEKFRVRPRCGVLNPSEKINVNILLKQEHHLSDANRDKFLVMTQPIFPTQGADIMTQMQEVWKLKPVNPPEQHRLTCIYKDNGESVSKATVTGFSPRTSIKEEVHLTKQSSRLEKQVRNTQILQCVTLIFLLVLSAAVVYLLKLQIAGPSGNEEEQFTCTGGKI